MKCTCGVKFTGGVCSDWCDLVRPPDTEKATVWVCGCGGVPNSFGHCGLYFFKREDFGSPSGVDYQNAREYHCKTDGTPDLNRPVVAKYGWRFANGYTLAFTDP